MKNHDSRMDISPDMVHINHRRRIHVNRTCVIAFIIIIMAIFFINILSLMFIIVATRNSSQSGVKL